MVCNISGQIDVLIDKKESIGLSESFCSSLRGTFLSVVSSQCSQQCELLCFSFLMLPPLFMASVGPLGPVALYKSQASSVCLPLAIIIF